MQDWSEGYVKGIDYTYDSYPELNPHRARLPFLNAGLLYPGRVEAACELGFGFGVSPNVYSAAGGATWWGTDFNPAHAAFAAELARETGADARLFDQPFAEFCARRDLPDFDFIGLHGVWTWVSDANRELILDFARRKLKPGGVLYASYNTLPGWSQIVPLRKLLIEHSARMSAPVTPVEERIDAATAFADALAEASPGLMQLYPIMSGRLKSLRNYGKNYIAHEYFNRDWEPMIFSEIALRMEGAKLSYACSADFAHHFDRFNLTQQQVSLLNAIPDRIVRETSRDFMINRQFRKDYWVKGAMKLDNATRLKRLKDHRVLLATDPASVTGEVDGALSGRSIDPGVTAHLTELLSDYSPRPLGEIGDALAPQGVPFDQVLEAVMILTGTGKLASVAEGTDAAETSRRFNEAVVIRAEYGQTITSLASPVTGGSVLIAGLHQKFLLARARGKTAPAQWAEAVWSEYLERGTRVVREGKMLQSDEENLNALIAEAETFAATRLPALVALGVVKG